MPDEPVDGYTDVEAPQTPRDHEPHLEIPGSPDPGPDSHAPAPLGADERARLEKEIREGDQEGHHGHVSSK